ncbi:polyphosphate--glucose phosphotransferase [Corynebacterium mendelii]|uniref:ROK family protein n=1 Tax=Corynebacterium mendelii TaxID=2765362 RepID=A0A939E0L3_9CORY|nr:ROK family protein [Corynebacterium mendelii]MBN9643347.1 ROK family protein [Corynebacterium mendelii]
MEQKIGFGIDVGGSGIKGARVDLTTGEFIGDRIKILTPDPATPAAVADTVRQIVEKAGWDGPVGITLPSVVREQTALSAANIDPSWIDTPVGEVFGDVLPGREISVLNDADAAGIAEARFGNPRAARGSVILLTFGTGIGSAFMVDGTLYPNTEIGHMIVGSKEAEKYASSAVKKKKDLSYSTWAARVTEIMAEYERLFWPSLFIVGGGISRKADKWVPLLDIRTPVVAAELRNRAGIVGAAMAVTDHIRP